ncbi:hypothetical protein B0T26DRAFT_164672 [Lasiosphaeria miniovina]|uniref:Uncharacterized protein n=1 Tax=Lasiosphaeria miniovina TaxID=1954250 RepID=A0AA40B644_9PEZI|nr:uncharacterized protein B0T26DRAFT_164672 [Lasiosphaeria miniovina]KAK0728237.1 hypothetical protein B0T26DRAFT_164672 [Lasiosphaeria miniovina]
MAAETSWFRGFQRSRGSAPTTAPSSASAGSAISTTAIDDRDAADQEKQQPHLLSPTRRRLARPSIHRVSSLLNLSIGGGGGSSSSHHNLLRMTTTPSPPLVAAGNTGGSGGDRGVRNALGDHGEDAHHEDTWHNPNIMQMVETLQAAMMSKRDSLAPIPIMYNSYVLALLEGFAQTTRQLRNAQSDLDELKDLRKKELEQFRSISEDWMRREGEYKAEIKRLELTLAKESKDGVLSVALARQESVVDRSESKRFQARLKRMSISQEHDSDDENMEKPRPAGPLEAVTCYTRIGDIPRILNEDNDIFMSCFVKAREKDQQRHQKLMTGADPVGNSRAPQHQRSKAKRRQNLRQTLDQMSPGQRGSQTHHYAGTANLVQNQLMQSHLDANDRETSPGSVEPISSGSSRTSSESFIPTHYRDSDNAPQVASDNDSLPDHMPQPSSGQGDGGKYGGMSLNRQAKYRDEALVLSDDDHATEGTQSMNYCGAIGSGTNRGPISRPQRSRGYSFEKGVDETLSLQSVANGPEADWHPTLASTTADRHFLASQAFELRPGGSEDLVGRLYPRASVWPKSPSSPAPTTVSSLDFGFNHLTPSTSADSVVWVGNGPMPKASGDSLSPTGAVEVEKNKGSTSSDHAATAPTESPGPARRNSTQLANRTKDRTKANGTVPGTYTPVLSSPRVILDTREYEPKFLVLFGGTGGGTELALGATTQTDVDQVVAKPFLGPRSVSTQSLTLATGRSTPISVSPSWNVSGIQGASETATDAARIAAARALANRPHDRANKLKPARSGPPGEK